MFLVKGWIGKGLLVMSLLVFWFVLGIAQVSLLKLFDRNLFTLYVRQFCSLTLSGMVPGQDF